MQRWLATMAAMVVVGTCGWVGDQRVRGADDVIADGDRTIRHWPNVDGAREQERAIEEAIIRSISRDRLRALHDLIASRPHRAGTVGDERVNDALADLFMRLGLEVERQELWVYLSDPVRAELAIVTPVAMTLPIREKAVEGDPYLADAELEIGFNAYSGSGEVTAEVVYANFGRKEDFEQLKEWGVDCTGKIVMARYGGNYRGYKAKFAEAAGAAGLIIYTDPGSAAGMLPAQMYPAGGGANESSIQRGSILTLDYVGDPLTPFVAATKNAKRLDPAEVALPSIPVQPIGWGAAAEILERMTGVEVSEDGWKGGLPSVYRLTGGSALKVRLLVEQTRSLKKVENIVATLPGIYYPEQKVIIGAHHDAWEFGAADPTGGTIAVLELARVFAEQAQQGNWPGRSLVFACWAAEEYGIIGSSEWVEAHADDLTQNAVAYINLDMASMGLNFGSSAAPLLTDVILDAARYVPQPVVDGASGVVGESVESVFTAWLGRANAGRDEDAKLLEPGIGNLGGGSDHVGFYCYLGIPSTGMSAHGSKGTSYHSNYDNLHWYRQVVGEDYESAALVAGMAGLTAWRVANAPLLPFNPTRYGANATGHLAGIMKRAKARRLIGENEVVPALTKLEDAIASFEMAAEGAMAEVLDALDDGAVEPAQFRALNTILLSMERRWIRSAGIPGRPWFRSLYAATDEDSGYASWMLPGLRYAVEHDDRVLLEEVAGWYVEVFVELEGEMRAVEWVID